MRWLEDDMSTTIKVKKGTLQEGESLCRTCRWVHMQKGFRESEEAINWSFGENMMKHWNENIFPSIQILNLSAEEVAKVNMPVLTIHGTRDRQAPYGGGREWVLMLPNARIVTIENAAHLPWIEAPEKVFGPIKTFLDGAWPEAAHKVESLAGC